jgi:hypothetical protein
VCPPMVFTTDEMSALTKLMEMLSSAAASWAENSAANAVVAKAATVHLSNGRFNFFALTGFHE